MKKICLIRDERPYWETIEKYLSAANAETRILKGDPSTESILECHPDLIVANAWSHRSMSFRVRQKPIIVIKEGTPPVALVRNAENRNLLITGWPLDRSQFLDITSRMLSVAPRRSFRTLIRVFTEGDSLGVLGLSKDFSLTGMAFATERDISEGSDVIVSFSIPASPQSIRLEAQVMRRTPGYEDSKVLYGVRFTNLGRREQKVLESFILDS